MHTLKVTNAYRQYAMLKFNRWNEGKFAANTYVRTYVCITSTYMLKQALTTEMPGMDGSGDSAQSHNIV